MNRLRELAALLQPPVQKVQEAKSMMGDWNGIKGIVTDALADLEDKLAEGGQLESVMDKYGITDLDTVRDKDGRLIMDRISFRTAQYKAEIERLLDEVELMFISKDAVVESQVQSQVQEMAHSSKFSSGAFGRRRDAVDTVNTFKAGHETYETTKGETYKAVRPVKALALKRGMTVLASYNKYNQGVELVEILGFTDNDEQYGAGGVKFDSLEELMSAKNVTSIAGLEALQEKEPYGHHFYMVIRDLENGDEGPFYYFFEGRIVRGSGAEPLTFTEVKKVKSTNEAKDAHGNTEYNTYDSWKRACKKANTDCWIEGDRDIAQAMVGPKPYKHGQTIAIGEWDGATGVVYKKR